jgi:uncharacterized protein YodC (DUF2158 family)
MAETFQAGDVVQLKSGGPVMTVVSVSKDLGGNDMVYCTWFSDSKRQNDGFPPVTLKLKKE